MLPCALLEKKTVIYGAAPSLFLLSKDDSHHTMLHKNLLLGSAVTRLKNGDVEFPPLRQHCVTQLAIADGSRHHHRARHPREQQPRLAAPFLVARTRHVLRDVVRIFVECLRQGLTHSLWLSHHLPG